MLIFFISLIATIQDNRNELMVDIFTDGSAVLEESPPTPKGIFEEFDVLLIIFKSVPKIPGVGEMMIISYIPPNRPFNPHNW
jgi:hypothetical protein